ncbi:MAG: nitroreductase family deazaflavin-dependent oxidoreductase [Mycobacterium sp.]|nr:nitroreductase family deazaflavin-dependent oxidoreductase [Mycobacterium sp.]
MGRRTRFGDLAARVLGTRAIVRAPIWLYRLRLGFLLGHRMLLLEHRGRRTGSVRHTVLEVVDRPHPGRYVVAAGFGRRAQWCRNVLADPRVRISVGTRRRVEATAIPLSADEVAATITRYRRQHPLAWSALGPTLSAALDAPLAELPMFELATTATSPP